MMPPSNGAEADPPRPAVSAGHGAGARASLAAKRFHQLGIAALVLAKLALLVHYGPTHKFDTDGYVQFADTIRSGTAWLHHAGLQETCIPPTTFRIVGYPALIALATSVVGAAWPWFVCVVQIFASVVATALLYRFAVALTGSRAVGLAVATLYAGSLQLEFDMTLLTDGLFASGVIVFVSGLGRRLLDGGKLTAVAAVAYGLVLAICFLLRDMLLFIVPAALPFIWIVVQRCGRPSRYARAGTAILLTAPLVVAVAGYFAWNVYRCGRGFVTTSVQTAGLQPLLEAASEGAPVFAGSSALDQAVRSASPTFSWDDHFSINRDLFERHGLDAPSIAGAVSAKFRETWLTMPATMARGAWTRLRSARLSEHLVDALKRWERLATIFGFQPDIAVRGEHSGRPRSLVVFAVAAAILTASRVLAWLFVAGVPLALVSSAHDLDARPRNRLLAAIWVLCIAFPAFYSLAHIDFRYLLPVLPFAVLGGLHAGMLLKSAAASMIASIRSDS